MPVLKLAYITTYIHDVEPLISAVKSLREKYGEAFEVQVRTGEDLLHNKVMQNFMAFAEKAHIAIFHLMGEPPNFNQMVERLKEARVPLFAGTVGAHYSPTLRSISTVSQKDYDVILAYTNYGGIRNFENLLLYLANRFLGTVYTVESPQKLPWHGIYHPDFKHTPTLEEYLSRKYSPGKPTIGVWFHQSHWQSGDTDFVDSIIKEIEKQGGNVIPVFFTGAKDPASDGGGLEWVIKNYFMKDGKVLVDAVISLLMFSLSMYLQDEANAGKALKAELNVPVLKA
ncbi:cobaltochelatase subunit CobN, partial [Candidatus Bathyarchaeota archaeon]|nr:cobaltochelatase subunit CobN [Candidatus Bathyarchaeota archaeon]